MKRDRYNVEELWKFFHEHRYYTTCELSALTGKSTATIENWRVKCGYKSGKKAPTRARRKERKKLDKLPESVWNNPEWFHKTYNSGFGVRPICQMTGLSIPAVFNRLKKYGVRIRPHGEAVASHNPYRTKEWLIDTYVNKRWTLTQCAEIAAVSPYTIVKWLAHFNLSIRDTYQKSAKPFLPPNGPAKSTPTGSD